MTKSSNKEEMEASQWTTELGPNDVLFGRGSGPNDHEGNVRFRDLVHARKDEYCATNHRQTKARIAQEVVQAVYDKNGRFLRKLDEAEANKFNVPEGVDAYCPVEENAILEKAKQALRQQREKTVAKGDADDGATAPAAALEERSKKESSKKTAKQQKEKSVVADDETSGADESSPMKFDAGMPPPVVSAYQDGGSALPYQQWSSDGMMRSNNYAPADPRHLQEYSPNNQWMGEMNQQRMADDAQVAATQPPVPVNAAYAQQPPQEHRQSLKVWDLMEHFNQMHTMEEGGYYGSTDTLGTFSDDPRMFSSNSTMGTIEPLPLDHRNSSISSSIFSYVKTGSESSVREDSSDQGRMSSGSFGTNSTPMQSAPRRRSSGVRRPPVMTREEAALPWRKQSGKLDSSEASLSLSDVNAMWDSRRQVSKVLEGPEGEEEESTNMGTNSGPRGVKDMQNDPDNFSSLGYSSMDIVKAIGGVDSSGSGLGASMSASMSGSGGSGSSKMSVVKSAGEKSSSDSGMAFSAGSTTMGAGSAGSLS